MSERVLVIQRPRLADPMRSSSKEETRLSEKREDPRQHVAAASPNVGPHPPLPKPSTWCPSHLFDKEMALKNREIEALRAKLAASDEGRVWAEREHQQLAEHLAKQKLAHETGLKALLKTTEQRREQEAEEHAAALASLHADCAAKLETAKAEHEALMKKTVNDIRSVNGMVSSKRIKQLERQTNAAQKALELAERTHREEQATKDSEHEAERKQHRLKLDAMERELRGKFRQLEMQLKEEALLALSAMADEHAAALTTKVVTLTKEEEQAMARLEQQLREEMAANLLAAKEKHDDALLQERIRLKAKHAEALKEADADTQSWLAETRRLQAELSLSLREIGRLREDLTGRKAEHTERLRQADQQKERINAVAEIEARNARLAEERALVVQEIAVAEMEAAAEAQAQAAKEVRAATANAQQTIAEGYQAIADDLNSARVRVVVAEAEAKGARLHMARLEAQLDSSTIPGARMRGQKGSAATPTRTSASANTASRPVLVTALAAAKWHRGTRKSRQESAASVSPPALIAFLELQRKAPADDAESQSVESEPTQDGLGRTRDQAIQVEPELTRDI